MARFSLFYYFTPSLFPTASKPLISSINCGSSLIIGGKIRQSEQSVVVYDYIFNFGELNILKAFICASGITIEKDISDYNLEEAITRKKSLKYQKRYMSPLIAQSLEKM
ncbi:hypothetical protein [Bacillus manliponensis]|uniref:hypothetical protein n=1 Tax=Bacillus manliponensis TaxID=574376 RepID=UPI0035132D14